MADDDPRSVAAPTPEPPRLAARFVAACERYADAPAVDDGTRVMTYRQLLETTSAIAATVDEHVPRGGAVGVVAAKTAWSIAAQFAVPLAGRSALFLDPDEPESWWDERAGRVGAPILLVDDGVAAAESTSPPTDGAVRPRLGPADCPSRPWSGADGPDVDPWIGCTSGSTGEPKFVWTSNAYAVASWDRHAADVERYGMRGDHVLALPPLSYVAGRLPVFHAFGSGACLRLVDTTRIPPGAIVDMIRTLAVRSLFAPPALLRSITRAADARSVVLGAVVRVECGGGALDDSDLVVCQRCFPDAVVTVHYGSTEIGIVSTFDVRPEDDPTAPHAGVVAPGYRVRIVDDDGTDVATGTVGDLLVVVGGPMGEYQDAPELWAALTSTDDDGTLWFRTGDRACVLADRRLELHGREDDRVKVNGVPVDLNVVAAAVRDLPGVTDAEVSAANLGGEARLVAWIVTHDNARPTVRELREQLGHALPRAMQPHLFRALGEIPRTTRGKVDRVALQAAAARELPVGVPRVAPRTAIEQSLADRFAAALGVDDVGVHESFFELGGDSLDALELLTEIVDDFALSSEREAVLEAALVADGSVAALAEAIGGDLAAGDRDAAVIRPDGVVTLVLRDDGPATAAPVVLVPGGGQTPVALRPLVERIPGCRVWALLPPGFRTGALPDRTVEELAERFADALLSADPRGEFVLAGYSFGGVVVQQLAAVIAARGGRVRLLALLDVDCPRAVAAPPPAFATRARRGWRRAPRGLWRRARRGFGRTPIVPAHTEAAPLSASMEWAVSLLATFRGEVVDAPTVVVRSAKAVAEGVPPDRGWSLLCRGRLETLDVAGNHRDVLREPAVSRIGEVLAAAAVPSVVTSEGD
ncbi:MAG: alpha/beta fold hydrolase [Acidimicrobiia bacterium]